MTWGTFIGAIAYSNITKESQPKILIRLFKIAGSIEFTISCLWILPDVFSRTDYSITVSPYQFIDAFFYLLTDHYISSVSLILFPKILKADEEFVICL